MLQVHGNMLIRWGHSGQNRVQKQLDVNWSARVVGAKGKENGHSLSNGRLFRFRVRFHACASRQIKQYSRRIRIWASESDPRSSAGLTSTWTSNAASMSMDESDSDLIVVLCSAHVLVVSNGKTSSGVCPSSTSVTVVGHSDTMRLRCSWKRPRKCWHRQTRTTKMIGTVAKRMYLGKLQKEREKHKIINYWMVCKADIMYTNQRKTGGDGRGGGGGGRKQIYTLGKLGKSW